MGLLDRLRALVRARAPVPDVRADTVTQLCICSEEFCYCGNTVEMPLSLAQMGITFSCAQCQADHHVWSPGGARS